MFRVIGLSEETNMLPNNNSRGIILELQDVEVAHSIYGAFNETQGAGRLPESLAGDRIPAMLQPAEDGSITLEDSQADTMMKFANAAVRNAHHKYKALDAKFTQLTELGVFSGPQVDEVEVQLPIQVSRIRSFSAFVLSANENLELSNSLRASEMA